VGGREGGREGGRGVREVGFSYRGSVFGHWLGDEERMVALQIFSEASGGWFVDSEGGREGESEKSDTLASFS